MFNLTHRYTERHRQTIHQLKLKIKICILVVDEESDLIFEIYPVAVNIWAI